MPDKITLSQQQGEQIVNLLLTHMESSREFIKHFFVPEAVEALEEEVKECKALLDAIIPQLKNEGGYKYEERTNACRR